MESIPESAEEPTQELEQRATSKNKKALDIEDIIKELKKIKKRPGKAKVNKFYQVVCYETNVSNPKMFKKPQDVKWNAIVEICKAYEKIPPPEILLSNIDDDQNLKFIYQELNTGFITWMKKFIESHGIEHLLDKIAQTSQIIRFGPASESSKSLDKLLLYLKCLFEIFNALDINKITEITETSIETIVNILVFSLFPGEHYINCLIYQLFCPIIDQAKKSSTVLDAMESYAIAQGLSGRFAIISDTANFDESVNRNDITRRNDESCRFYTFVFVNMLFKCIPELYRRVSIRYELYKEGFKQAVEGSFPNDTESVKEEIYYFKAQMLEDEKSIMSIFGRSGISPMSTKSTANSMLDWPDESKNIASFILELTWAKNKSESNFDDYTALMINLLTALHHCEDDDQFDKLAMSIWSLMPIKVNTEGPIPPEWSDLNRALGFTAKGTIDAYSSGEESEPKLPIATPQNFKALLKSYNKLKEILRARYEEGIIPPKPKKRKEKKEEEEVDQEIEASIEEEKQQQQEEEEKEEEKKEEKEEEKEEKQQQHETEIVEEEVVEAKPEPEIKEEKPETQEVPSQENNNNNNNDEQPQQQDTTEEVLVLPPPPPPPPPPALCPKKPNQEPPIKTRTFFWESFNYQQSRGTLWEQLSDKENTINIDIAQLCQFFKVTQSTKSTDNKASQAPKEVTLVNEKKSNGISIFVGAIKLPSDQKSAKSDSNSNANANENPDSEPDENSNENQDSNSNENANENPDENQDSKPGKKSDSKNSKIAKCLFVKNCFLNMNKGNAIDINRLSNLKVNLPTPDDYKLIDSYKGRRELLGLCEQFYLLMKDVSFLDLRIDLITMSNDIESLLVDKYMNSLLIYEKAIGEVKNSPNLKMCFSVILKIGNKLNGGTRRGGAYGFKINILNKLCDTRSSGSDYNLMNYIATQANNNFNCFKELRNDLKSVPAVPAMDFEAMKAAFSEYKVLMNKCIKNKKEIASKLIDDSLPAYAESFVQKVKPIINQFDKLMKKCDDEFIDLRGKYADEELTPQEFFGIFANFMDKFDQAELENAQKEKKEASK